MRSVVLFGAMCSCYFLPSLSGGLVVVVAVHAFVVIAIVVALVAAAVHFGFAAIGAEIAVVEVFEIVAAAATKPVFVSA